MKKVFAFLVVVLLSVPAHAATQGFGVGVILGEPTGLSLKVWLDGGHALDAAAAWSLDGSRAFQFHADYLIVPGSGLHGAELKGRAPFYYGIGARLWDGDHRARASSDDHKTHLGVRIPLGISYLPAAAPPLEFFFEIAPGLDLAPATDFFINGGIGVRYYFR